ncbi:uncharacterized protein LOC116259951 [Nymphaea colorata]|nr:uncharacterized protein LOC116259951 [Nymphaea colorata]XP_031493846.1 uncharacterized protein LOC116259951 [Nymphaea colorata]XP_031493847.1 uncharacterized protein LOC116259951 [Nymphaea colorata]
MGKTPAFSCTEQSRKFECRCVSYDSLMLNTVILVLFFFLGWKIFEISTQCKSLNRCYGQLEKNLADGFRCDGRGSLNGYLADSKGLTMGNHDGTRESDQAREGTSGNGSPMCNDSFVSCSCEEFPMSRCRDGSTGIRMQDLIDDNHDEADLNLEISADRRMAEIEVHENPEGEQDLDSAALRRAIKIEQGYRAAAYLELEKERKAAASAAHEAMVMILRLQNEKHLIELQAQQQQREAQQRQLYDEEVIQSLREIISKQELEREELEDQLTKMRRKVYSANSADDVDQWIRNMSAPSTPIPENNISDHVCGFMKDAEAHQAS